MLRGVRCQLPVHVQRPIEMISILKEEEEEEDF